MRMHIEENETYMSAFFLNQKEVFSQYCETLRNILVSVFEGIAHYLTQ